MLIIGITLKITYLSKISQLVERISLIIPIKTKLELDSLGWIRAVNNITFLFIVYLIIKILKWNKIFNKIKNYFKKHNNFF